MPFAYYGAKHRLAPKYPAPVHDTIVEPFAGSAGYACHWGQGRQVILIEVNAYIVDLWRRLQRMTAAEVDDAVRFALAGERTMEPLVAFAAGGSQVIALCNGKDRQITPRMRQNTPKIARRVKRHLSMIANWQIIHASYDDAPDIEATWFIDPPYQPLVSLAGSLYVNDAAAIDYAVLGAWCQSRQGQVIVCEQEPAAWLPFVPFAKQTNAVLSAERTEVIWHNMADRLPQQLQLWGKADDETHA